MGDGARKECALSERPASIEALREQLAALERPLVEALSRRARHKRGLPHNDTNAALEADYREALLAHLCDPGEDGEAEACRVLDHRVLDLLDQRLAMGARLARAKAQHDPEQYARLVRASDRAGLIRALTDLAAEKRVLQRVHALALELADATVALRILEAFRHWIIPKTKEAEADSLLQA